MTTSLIRLNASIFPLCLQNKIPTPTRELSMTWSLSTCLPHLSLPLALSSKWLNFQISKEPRARFLLPPSLHMCYSLCLSLLPFNYYSSFSSDILLPESLTWCSGHSGYHSHLFPESPVSYQSNIRLDSMEDIVSLSDLLSRLTFASFLQHCILSSQHMVGVQCWISTQIRLKSRTKTRLTFDF